MILLKLDYKQENNYIFDRKIKISLMLNRDKHIKQPRS